MANTPNPLGIESPRSYYTPRRSVVGEVTGDTSEGCPRHDPRLGRTVTNVNDDAPVPSVGTIVGLDDEDPDDRVTVRWADGSTTPEWMDDLRPRNGHALVR